MMLASWSDVVTDTVYICAAALIIGIVIATVVTFSHWMEPRLKQIRTGKKHVKGWIPCCPPGLGCNDPDKDNNGVCLRREARRIAQVDELIMVDKAWSEYCAVPERNTKQRDAALNRYQQVRDGIVARAMNDVADMINSNRQAQLPAGMAESKKVRGEVM